MDRGHFIHAHGSQSYYTRDRSSRSCTATSAQDHTSDASPLKEVSVLSRRCQSSQGGVRLLKCVPCPFHTQGMTIIGNAVRNQKCIFSLDKSLLASMPNEPDCNDAECTRPVFLPEIKHCYDLQNHRSSARCAAVALNGVDIQ